MPIHDTIIQWKSNNYVINKEYKYNWYSINDSGKYEKNWVNNAKFKNTNTSLDHILVEYHDLKFYNFIDLD